jgi:hypothetical protein
MHNSLKTWIFLILLLALSTSVSAGEYRTIIFSFYDEKGHLLNDSIVRLKITDLNNLSQTYEKYVALKEMQFSSLCQFK